MTARSVKRAKRSGKGGVLLKVGLLGDAYTGKRKLLECYVGPSKADQDYVDTLGLYTSTKQVKLDGVNLTVSFWCIGATKDDGCLMPMVCSEASAIIFVFDLTRESSLMSMKNWYKNARRESKTFFPILVGTHYDLFQSLPDQIRLDMSSQSRHVSRRMRAPLIFCSAIDENPLNIREVFRVSLSCALGLEITSIHEEVQHWRGPLLVFKPETILLGDDQLYNDTVEIVFIVRSMSRMSFGERRMSKVGHFVDNQLLKMILKYLRTNDEELNKPGSLKRKRSSASTWRRRSSGLMSRRPIRKKSSKPKLDSKLSSELP